MGTAPALSIGWVIRRTTITHLDHVIGEHSVMWFCLAATLTRLLIGILAAPAGTGDHHLTPCPIFRG